jgi:hypothetical protein
MEHSAFTISCWNIQGLRSTALALKSRNPDFTNEIQTLLSYKKHCIEETDPLVVLCYRELVVPSIKLPGVKQGRNSGVY